jgi:hypothetical protein
VQRSHPDGVCRAAAAEHDRGRFSEKEAMEISGHRTRYVFDRYHIVSERRLKEMTAKLDTFSKEKNIVAVANEMAAKQRGVVH